MRSFWIYDGDQAVLQFDGDTAADLSHRYLWGDAVDQLLADETVDDGGAEDVLWTLTDWQGTVRDLATYDTSTDTTTIANHKVYDAYGNVYSETNSATDTLFGYTGRLWDDDIDLQWNLNRWYDPATSRWLSEDPIGFAAGDPNLYRYVGNSPAGAVDPSGLEDTYGPFTQRYPRSGSGSSVLPPTLSELRGEGRTVGYRDARAGMLSGRTDPSVIQAFNENQKEGSTAGLSATPTQELVAENEMRRLLREAREEMLSSRDFWTIDICDVQTQAMAFLQVGGGFIETLVGVSLATGGGLSEGGSLGTTTPVSVPAMMLGTALATHGVAIMAAGLEYGRTGIPQRPITSQALDLLTCNESHTDWMLFYAEVLAGGQVYVQTARMRALSAEGIIGDCCPCIEGVLGDETFFGRVLTPAVDDLSSGVVKTFTDGRVTPSVTQGEITLYRVWGEEGGRVGSYLTRTRPTSATQALNDLALDPQWGNSRTFVTEVRVPPGTPIYEGTAAAVGALRGGGNQVYIPRGWLSDEMFHITQPLPR